MVRVTATDLRIILSLRCGELKGQNSSRGGLARSLGHNGNTLGVDCAGRGFQNHRRQGIQQRHDHPREEDGIVLKRKPGISKVYFSELMISEGCLTFGKSS